MTRISALACLLLVALRMAIGWHFVTEGVHKLHSHYEGKTSWNDPWTGEGFFKEGIGPAAPYARGYLHLDDRDALARLKATDHRLPDAVNAEWDDYFTRFAAHYELTEQQRLEVPAKLGQARQETANWLAGDTPTEVKKTVAWGTETVQQTVPMRLAEYEAKVKEVEDALSRRLPAFNKDVEKARLRSVKADANKILASLVSELETRTAEMKKSLADVLTPEQKAQGPVPEPAVRKPIEWLDVATMWAHTVLGACLMLGLFSRLSSILLALFLVSVNLVAPALPYAPAPPGAIGFYLYINLYVIEFVALLALASMPTGRWFGIDALFYSITHGPRRVRPVVADVPPRQAAPFAYPAPRGRN
jgi:uncharacterized membrane protein YphA (DoxX/SURF4 family)